jgi:hypothetical protein
MVAGALGAWHLINVATRDGSYIRKRQFPAACLGFSPVRSAGRLETVAIGEPVNVAGCTLVQATWWRLTMTVLCVSRQLRLMS